MLVVLFLRRADRRDERGEVRFRLLIVLDVFQNFKKVLHLLVVATIELGEFQHDLSRKPPDALLASFFIKWFPFLPFPPH